MKLTLFYGSDPVYLEIEENGYKPKISMANSFTAVVAEIQKEDRDDLIALLGGRNYNYTIGKLEDEITTHEGTISDLRSDLEEAQDKIDSLEDEIERLKDELNELNV